MIIENVEVGVFVIEKGGRREEQRLAEQRIRFLPARHRSRISGGRPAILMNSVTVERLLLIFCAI